MTWNWEQPVWPDFAYDSRALEPLEKQFLLRSGEFIGACRHIGADDQETLKIERISDEAVKTLRHTRYRLNIAGAARK